MRKIDKNMKQMSKNNISKISEEASAFKNFVSRGNVVDMAVGVIVGGAFGKIVTSLVNDMLTPIIGVLLGGLNFTDLKIKICNANVLYGNFIQSIIDFLIISICIFVMVRLFDKFKKKEEKKEEKTSKSSEVLLLEEIRDLIKENKWL